MKKVGLISLLLFTALASFAQIDTTAQIDISQNVNRQAVSKEFGEYITEYRKYHNLSYETLQRQFSVIASITLEYNVCYTKQEIKRMEQNNYVPLLIVQRAIIKHISESY